MSIDVAASASAAYVLPQTVSPLSAVELAMASGNGDQPAGAALSKVVSRLQEAHRQATQPEARVPYVQVQEIHLLPSMHDDLPTVVTSANRVDVYV